MPLPSDAIDPTIRTILRERMQQIVTAQTALDPMSARVQSAAKQRAREMFRRYAGYFWAAGGTFLASLASIPVLEPVGEGLAVLMFLALQGSAAGLVVRGFVKSQQELSRNVDPELMRAAAKLVALSRAEQLYCEAVAALAEAGPLVGESVQQQILQQLNLSLESHRKLEAPLKQQQAAFGGGSIQTLEQELAGLTARRDALADTTARDMMEQSVTLCARRLEHARALEPAREQAEAQQELILQTFASVQASLARTTTAPAPAVEAEVGVLQQSMTRINNQARAVEEAVTEVLALRA